MREHNNSPEDKEHLSTIEELRALLKEIINGEFTEVKTHEDEDGIYYFEVKTLGESEGEFNEYIYIRKGTYPKSDSSATEINIYYYQDNFPIGGKAVAKFIAGEWKIV